jgi:putative toxin-antitoxin system antitoxin component (TIGR02293 family)
MLTNYDAKAVAALMGIAFLREAETVAEGDFTIRLGDATMQVVEARADQSLAAFGASGDQVRKLALGQRTVSLPSPALIEKAVERGLPRQALRHVAESLAGGDKARAASLEWGVVPKTTLERRMTQLSPQESERTERVARLFVHARRALGTEAEAREFMTSPHPALEGRSPVDAARSDLGTRRTEQVLNALEYGLAL